MTKKWNLDFVVATRSHSCCPLPWKAIPLPLGWMESSRRQWRSWALYETQYFFQSNFSLAIKFGHFSPRLCASPVSTVPSVSPAHGYLYFWVRLSLDTHIVGVQSTNDCQFGFFFNKYDFVKHHFFQALVFTSNRCVRVHLIYNYRNESGDLSF